MSKKKQRNPFFFFMLDMKEELRRQGRNVPMAQMSAIAGPKWSKLSEAEKAPYTLRAKNEKRNPTSNASVVSMSSGRMDCMGELLSERKDVLAELQEKRRRQAEDLKLLLTSKKDVMNETFFLLDIQPQCELKECVADRWLPCEIAVSGYSLIRGIRQVFHSFIHPGPIPMGYRYDAQSQSERTHMLPVDGVDTSDRDYLNVLKKLQSFISSFQDSASPNAPLVFVKREFAERVEFLLSWLANKAGVELFIDRVFELELLLLRLDALSSINGMTQMTVFQATELINTGAYDYESNIRCQWHEERESKFCSQCVVIIYSYVMSDNLCPKFGISITAAHLPEQSDQPVGVVVPPRPTSFQNTSLRGVVIEDTPPPLVLRRGRGRGLSALFPYEIRQPKCTPQY